MKKSLLLISAFALSGFMLSGAASASPPTTVDTDVGVTKEAKCTSPNHELVAMYTINAPVIMPEAAMQEQAPSMTIMHEKGVAPCDVIAYISLRPPAPERSQVESVSYHARDHYGTDKLYLANRALRLCTRGAASAAHCFA